MFESFQSVLFPANLVAGDTQYVSFNLPDGERKIELQAWGNYPAYQGVYLFPNNADKATIASQLAGEVAGDMLLAIGNQIVAKRLLPDGVRGATVYVEKASAPPGILVVSIRLCERV